MSNTANELTGRCKKPDETKPAGLELVMDLLKSGISPLDALYQAFDKESGTDHSAEEVQVIRSLVLTNAVIDGLMAVGMSEMSAVELLSAYTESVLTDGKERCGTRENAVH